MIVFERLSMPAAERGIALITVLLIVAVLSAVVTRLSFANQIWLRQVENAAANARAEQTARAAQLWIRVVLDGDDGAVDGLADVWAATLPPLPVASGTVSGRIDDLQGRFNLNNLVGADGTANPLAVEQFERLLRVLDLDPGLAHAVVDWIDADDVLAGAGGAEDGYYLSLTPPYLAANRPLVTPAELRLVRGVSSAVWRRLEPRVSALPVPTHVNVNTASAEVLAAVVTNWGAAPAAIGPAERWVAQARTLPAPDLEAFADAVLTAGAQELAPGLGVNTGYFRGRVEARFDRVTYTLDTLYERSGGRTSIVHQERVIR